ncbi:proline-rich protein HaeIII subfamily 1-like [Penaeus monodon]|uniref:proline-rich protein HaeIII subfamily 1-like n=1 Tax=Penaeus monodon TaxID=6687 RepID=UPI0018A79DA0|nr:proline-rich protein HaeIII subfamily 1-like [Penaeus monodon]
MPGWDQLATFLQHAEGIRIRPGEGSVLRPSDTIRLPPSSPHPKTQPWKVWGSPFLNAPFLLYPRAPGGHGGLSSGPRPRLPLEARTPRPSPPRHPQASGVPLSNFPVWACKRQQRKHGPGPHLLPQPQGRPPYPPPHPAPSLHLPLIHLHTLQAFSVYADFLFKMQDCSAAF